MSAWQDFIKNNKSSRVKPWDVINPNSPKAQDEEAERRYAICEKCPRFLGVTKQCKECGCFMNLKTKLADATCPLGKW